MSLNKIKAQDFNLNNLIYELNNTEFIIKLDNRNEVYKNSNNLQEVNLYELIDSEKFNIYVVLYDETIQFLNNNGGSYSTRRSHIVLYSKKHKKYLFIHFYRPSTETFFKLDNNEVKIKFHLSVENGFVNEMVLTDDVITNKFPIKVKYNTLNETTNFIFSSCTNDYMINTQIDVLNLNIDDIIEFFISNRALNSINNCKDQERLHNLQFKLPYYLRDEAYRNW